MCGIIAYIGKDDAGTVLLDGLQRLEYRGYDSSGLVLFTSNSLFLEKAVGEIARLERKLNGRIPPSTIGIAHTRWATHGSVTEANAHPHTDCRREIFLVHNGIIENFAALKQGLERKGHRFCSETDSEVLAHLVEQFYEADPLRALRRALQLVEGTYGLALLHRRHPAEIFLARRGSPMAIGLGEAEALAASDPQALASRAKQVIYLDEGELARLTATEYSIVTADNVGVERVGEALDIGRNLADKDNFSHFMLKEIFEQPRVVADALRGRIDRAAASAKLGGLETVRDRLAKARHLMLVSCGTSYHASLFGKYVFSELTDLVAEAELGSEFRYRTMRLSPASVVLALSQSGETADTLAALRMAKEQGVLTLGMVNVVGSTIARETDAGVYMHAGPEIGVASTKSFLAQLALLVLIAVLMGRTRSLPVQDAGPILDELEAMPEKILQVLRQADDIKNLAERYARYDHFLYIGRKFHYPIALEGALKLKEISYIHAEAYAAGEMKHGPIALIDRAFATLALAPRDQVYPKLMSNIEEIRARNGSVIAIGTEGDEALAKLSEQVIYVPATADPLYPLLTTVVLQLFAYYCAAQRGCEIDKPRNLAKSVTVE